MKISRTCSDYGASRAKKKICMQHCSSGCCNAVPEHACSSGTAEQPKNQKTKKPKNRKNEKRENRKKSIRAKKTLNI